ncbi:MAG: hypothetical protein ABIJ21_02690 [Nanoarchaeota archaeon]
MGEDINVLVFPLEEDRLEVSLDQDAVSYRGIVEVKSAVLPLNSYSIPIPGSDDEFRFGIFGDLTATVVRRFERIKKELYLPMRVPGVQLAYYDYNEQSSQRVQIRMFGLPLHTLQECLTQRYWFVTEKFPMLRDPALESPPLRELFGPLFMDIYAITERELKF